MTAAHAAGDAELAARIHWHLVAEGAADAAEAAYFDTASHPTLPTGHLLDASGPDDQPTGAAG
ncbi:hypothetical protein AB0M36_18515 [Actinoplanes sp. NPDC051346]|uniref:hypothetical protein n=1 Tax=Actinoplanes sp. NPDC051346 TaxID=3155048 RepID=UPI003439E0DF